MDLFKDAFTLLGGSAACSASACAEGLSILALATRPAGRIAAFVEGFEEAWVAEEGCAGTSRSGSSVGKSLIAA
jgi:phage terminase large subunit-like protein